MSFIVCRLSLYHGLNLPTSKELLRRNCSNKPKMITKRKKKFNYFYVRERKEWENSQHIMYTKLIFSFVNEFRWITHGSHQTFLSPTTDSFHSQWIHFFSFLEVFGKFSLFRMPFTHARVLMCLLLVMIIWSECVWMFVAVTMSKWKSHEIYSKHASYRCCCCCCWVDGVEVKCVMKEIHKRRRSNEAWKTFGI